MKKTTTLMILDGLGICDKTDGNAVALANTPNLDMLMDTYPHTTLGASGMSVGLPDGQMGNSEVGHLNIGAGRIVYQELTRITKSIADGDFFENAALLKAMKHVSDAPASADGARTPALHIMGLLSDGGVHSHINHLFALIDMAKKNNISRLYLHCFLDGRDVPPRCAKKYIDMLENHMKEMGLGEIASISGRYYAMDRDKRWERVQLAYDALVCGTGQSAATASVALENAYARGENDEFVLPTVIEGCDGRISDDDSVIMFNFRPDRAREITRTLCDSSFDGFSHSVFPKNLCYVCMTQYDASMPGVEVAFPPQHHKNTLGEYVSGLGLTQLRTAETEKYAHVTFFFNGGVEEPNKNEDRVLIPSPKVATYDLQPEMSAAAVKDTAVDAINSGKYDLIIMNFANPDMVGHTGILAAAVKAVETVDSCVGEIYRAVKAKGGNLFITADHGNADTMLDEAGNVITAHSTNPVPAILITDDASGNTGKTDALQLRTDGILADIAPTLLQIMGLTQPEEMTGKTLITML